jgi:hypothetical protein
VISLDGKILIEKNNQKIPTSLEIGSFETGIYFLEIVSGKYSVRKKIVVEK